MLHKNHHGLSLGPGGDPLGDPRVSSNTFKVEPITRFLPQKSGYQILGLRGEVGGEPQINLNRQESSTQKGKLEVKTLVILR